MTMTATEIVGDLSRLGPTWVHDCPECRYGIIAAPPLLNGLPLYECRRMQAQEGLIVFCVCEAGKRYLKYLMGLEPWDPSEGSQGIGTNVASETYRDPSPEFWQAKPPGVVSHRQPGKSREADGMKHIELIDSKRQAIGIRICDSLVGGRSSSVEISFGDAAIAGGAHPDEWRNFDTPEVMDALIVALIDARNSCWPWPPFTEMTEASN